MKNKRFIFATIISIPILLVTLSGCLDFDRWDVTYKIAKDLSGQLSLQVTRIHSNEATQMAQEKEMQQLYQNFIKTMSGFNQGKLFDSTQATLSKKNSRECFGSVRAHFKTVTPHILDLVDEGFKMKQEKDLLYFELPKRDENKGGFSQGSFTLVFEGVVVSHNAPKTKKMGATTQALTWDLSKIRETGISFSLKLS